LQGFNEEIRGDFKGGAVSFGWMKEKKYYCSGIIKQLPKRSIYFPSVYLLMPESCFFAFNFL